ncbi:MAG: acetyltransferase [Methylocystis sp.]|nr:acetyltransferase [Methylocystis sp.]
MNTSGINQFPQEVILWGGTGQAKVVRPIIEHFGSRVSAVFDDTPNLPPPFPDVDLFCGWEGFERWISGRINRKRIGFCVAIGNPHGRVRLRLHDRLRDAGFTSVSLAHSTAWIDKRVQIGEGAQIMAGAIILTDVCIGRQCIVNTKASVDHEDILGDGTEVAPGATLCGAVETGVNVWIGAGAIVLPRRRIGDDAIVGAGAVVVKDVPPNVTVVGVPNKLMIKKDGLR